MRKSRAALLIVFFSCILSTDIARSAESVIDYLPARRYFETTLQEISQSKESIKVYMFLISARPGEPKSKVMQLLDALIAAKARGVSVEVHLDQNIPYGSFGQGEVDRGTEGKNKAAFDYLTANKIPVYYDNAADYAHGKTVIIDGKTTIFGSTNWSQPAFEKNSEVNAVIRSPEFAVQVLNDLAALDAIVPKPASSVRQIRVPKAFLAREDLLGRMVTKQDGWNLSTYLFLIKEYDGNPEGRVVVDYDKLAVSIGIADRPRFDYRRQLVRNLQSLQNDYRLLAIDKRGYSQPAEVILKDISSPTNSYSAPTADYFEIPETYWTYGWDSRLTLVGRTMLLLNFMYSKAGDQLTSWHRSREELQANHHVGSATLSFGTLELQKWNLIDVLYKRTSDDPNNPKSIAIYSPNELYDPKELEQRFIELESKYDKETIVRVRKYAEVVYRENNYDDVLTLLGLDAEYGRKTMEKAAQIISAKKRSNPKRTMGYFVGTVRKMGSA
jgi:hypothetical protein